MRWNFEPGHTEAEFKAKHMMVSWVKGFFKNIEGKIEFDPKNIKKSSVELEIDAKTIFTGDDQRDDHLRSADFLDVTNHPKIKFKSNKVRIVGPHEFCLTGELTIRGITKKVTLNVKYLGQWPTPWWEDGKDKGPKMRAGFMAFTKINRHDYKVSWNDKLAKGGIVVGDFVYITIDVEGILEG